MREALSEAVERIRRAKNVGVATHVDPDGDGIGSLLGMALILSKMGKNVAVRWHKGQPFPPQYAFLSGKELLSGGPDQIDVFLALDCGSPSRLGAYVKESERAPVLISIDHHPDNKGFKGINIVNSAASSTCEIVVAFARAAGVELDEDIALCLYVGILTDTGRFQYSNTTSQTHRIAADLIEIGHIRVTEVFHRVFEQVSYGSLQLMSAVVGSAVLVPELKLIYSVVTRELIKASGGKLEELETLIDYLRMEKDADVTALIKEMENGSLRISLRSKGPLDTAKIARLMGGGGHRNAAAYPSSAPIADTIDTLKKAIDEERRTILGGRNLSSR